MAPNEKILNADLMKDYFKNLLIQHGHSDDASRLDGFVIKTGEDAQTVTEIIRHMREFSAKEIQQARLNFLEKLQAASS